MAFLVDEVRLPPGDPLPSADVGSGSSDHRPVSLLASSDGSTGASLPAIALKPPFSYKKRLLLALMGAQLELKSVRHK